MLEHRLDPLTAQALAITFDGLVVRSLVRGTPLSAAEVEPILRRVFGAHG